MKSLGEKIKALRVSLGLSQRQLAERIDVVTKTIERYEKDESRPDMHGLVMLATFFDVSADYLLGLSGMEDQMEEEKYKISKTGRYNALYKRYLDCKNNRQFNENCTYYWIYFDDEGNIGGQTNWVGWTDETRELEIRKLCPVIPEAAVEVCTEMYGKPLVINDKEDADIFRIFGGQAIVKKEICEQYLPEFCEDYIGENPEWEILRRLEREKLADDI